jgi:hypothetical protein
VSGMIGVAQPLISNSEAKIEILKRTAPSPA